MYKELIINAIGPEIRVALLENGIITEFYIDRNDESRQITGNIYKGRVQRVLPGMQAAFVDIGLPQAAFIYVDDLMNHKNGFGSIITNNNGDENCETGCLIADTAGKLASAAPAGIEKPSIETFISEGQEILVQVARSPIGSKGARLTTNISIPGRFLVLMPSVDHIGISRRIEDEQERARLKSSVESLRTELYGYIVRTAAEGVEEFLLAQEMYFLNNMWKDIQKRFHESGAPKAIHQELSVTLRCVRDLLAHEADRVVIDSEDVYRSVLSFVEKFIPHLKESVLLYSGSDPIFDAYNLEVDIQRALKKKVWLKCGGYIVIEITEALVAIDVNTGRYVGTHNFEETILKTNLEAVKEIAYQIRLRNLGGIIIIDFIDMAEEANREKVYNALCEALKKDKAKTNVLPMSDMGLIQMTRKRVIPSLPRTICEPCYYCEGEGMLLSKKSICYNIYRDVIRATADGQGEIHIHVHPDIANILLGEERNLICELENHVKRTIGIYPQRDYHIEQYEIFEIDRSEKRP